MTKELKSSVAIVAVVLGWVAFAPPGNLFAQASVHRGTPERQGNAWVELATCEVPVHDGGRLIVKADFGTIVVNPGPNGRMNCQVHLRAYKSSEEEARQYFRAYQLSLRTLEDGKVILVGKSAHSGEHRGLSVDYQVSVPRKFNLDLETQGGDLKVGNLDGEFLGKTAGGDITSGDVSGPVRVETAGGDISLGNMGEQVEARTAGGAIRLKDVQGDADLETSGGEIVTGVINGSVRAQTAGGDIILHGAKGPVRAQTAGGQIQVGQCQAGVEAQTAGGNIRLHGARGLVVAQTAGGSIDLFRMQGPVRAQSAAGPILAEISADRASFAASQLATSVGDVKVFLPPNLPLTINAAIQQAFGRKILSDFPIQIQGDEETFRHRSMHAEGELNGGGKLLRINTVMGNIEILKLNQQRLEELKKAQELMWKAWQQHRRQLLEDKNPE